MKITLICLGLTLALASAAPLFEDEHVEHHTNFVRHNNFDVMNDETHLKQYRDVLRLFKYLHQQVVFKDHVDIVDHWKIQDHLDSFTKPEIVREFLEYYHKGMLPRDTVFTIYNEDHLKQAIALCKLMYFAKDFETFYKTAVWARYHMNQGMFLYSYSVALLHRQDTNTMILPPIYEIYPYYFFEQDLIQKVRDYKQTYDRNTHKHEDNHIDAKYSDWFNDIKPEHSMTYFTEDLGINQFYYYYNLYRPFWMNFEEFNVLSFDRGEEFYYFHQQLLARYYLESLSNGLGKLDVTNMHSSLYLHEDMEKSDTFNFLKVYEKEIRDMLETGFIVNKDGKKINLYEPKGFETLARYIEFNPESTNAHFYGYLQVLARYYISHQEHHTNEDINIQLEKRTWLYDTNFWTFVKKMMMNFQTYKTHLSHYTLNELKFDGVKIENVDVSDLITYFEGFNTELSNVLDVTDAELEHNNFDIRVDQQRLNHKQFTYKIELTSEKPIETVVRVFIGPKYDEQGKLIRLDENRMNFVEFDRFKHQLTTGQNLIKRNSRDTFFSVDRTSFQQLYRESMLGFSEHNINWNKYNLHYTFPNRFLLPKGKQDGQMFQFFVIVSPFKAHQMTEMKHLETTDNYFRYPIVGLGVQYLDDYPLGYPFDRTINEEAFMVPNMYFKDVTIYHNSEEDLKEHDSTNIYKRSTKKDKNMDKKHMRSMDKKHMKDMKMDKKHMKDMYMDKKHMDMDMDMYMDKDMDMNKHMYADKKYMKDMYMDKYMNMDKKHMDMYKKHMDMDKKHMDVDKKHMDMDMYMDKNMDMDKHMYADKKYMKDMYMDKYMNMDKKHMDMDMYMDKDMDMDKHMYADKKYMKDMYMDKKHMKDMYMDKYMNMDKKHMDMDLYMDKDMDMDKHMYANKKYMKDMYMDKYMNMDKKHMDMDMDMYMDKDMDMDKHMYAGKKYMKDMYMDKYMNMDKKHMKDMYMDKYMNMDKKHMDMDMYMDKDMDMDKHMYADKKYMKDMYMDKYMNMDKKHMDMDMYMDKDMNMDKKHMKDMYIDKYMNMDKKHMDMDMYMDKDMDMDKHMYADKKYMKDMYMDKYMNMDKKHMKDMYMDKYMNMDKKHMDMDMYMDKDMDMDKHMYADKKYMKDMYMDKYMNMDKKHMDMDKYMDKKHMMDMYNNKNMYMDKNMDMDKHTYMGKKHMMDMYNMDTKNMYYPMHDMNTMEDMNQIKYMNYPMYNKYATNYRNTNDMDYNYKNMMLNKHFGDTNIMTPKNMYETDMHMYNMDFKHERPMTYDDIYRPMTKMNSMDMNMDNQMYYKLPYQSTKYTMDLPLRDTVITKDSMMDMHMMKDKYDW